MSDFKLFLDRHGEAAVQALIESWERAENRSPPLGLSLEGRWMALMQGDSKHGTRDRTA